MVTPLDKIKMTDDLSTFAIVMSGARAAELVRGALRASMGGTVSPDITNALQSADRGIRWAISTARVHVGDDSPGERY
jgi:hypothetical protein